MYFRTYESAEAVTTDGVHWDTCVIDGELLEGLVSHNILAWQAPWILLDKNTRQHYEHLARH